PGRHREAAPRPARPGEQRNRRVSLQGVVQHQFDLRKPRCVSRACLGRLAVSSGSLERLRGILFCARTSQAGGVGVVEITRSAVPATEPSCFVARSPSATIPTSLFCRLSTGKRRTCSRLMFLDTDSVSSSSKTYLIPEP